MHLQALRAYLIRAPQGINKYLSENGIYNISIRDSIRGTEKHHANNRTKDRQGIKLELVLSTLEDKD